VAMNYSGFIKKVIKLKTSQKVPLFRFVQVSKLSTWWSWQRQVIVQIITWLQISQSRWILASTNTWFIKACPPL